MQVLDYSIPVDKEYTELDRRLQNMQSQRQSPNAVGIDGFEWYALHAATCILFSYTGLRYIFENIPYQIYCVRVARYLGMVDSARQDVHYRNLYFDCQSVPRQVCQTLRALQDRDT